jgi:hypothetical protein
MQLRIQPSNRFCAVEPVKRLSPARMKRDLFAGNGVQGSFTLISTPAAPRDPTVFKVYGTGKDIVLAVALFDTANPALLRQNPQVADGIELLFDPYHDHIGRIQFNFSPNGEVALYHHLPYPESHSTAFRWPAVKEFGWESDPKHPVRWFLARFEAAEVFRKGDCCGFNVARTGGVSGEASSWNHCSGNGFPDATSFGHLYLDGVPARIEVETATLDGHILEVGGSVTGCGCPASFQLADPVGTTVPIVPEVNGDSWRVRMALDKPVHGRYRLYPGAEGRNLEPDFLFFDLSLPEKRPFRLCMTYDMPDNVIPNHYTPERLRQEVRMLADWGIRRLDWLDYSDFPGLWDARLWGTGAVLTFRHCGDLLRLAVQVAKEHGLEFFGLLKPFDIGFNGPGELVRRAGMVRDIENRPLMVVPPIARHQEWTMRAHPEWCLRPAPPITSLRLFSNQPFRRLSPKDIRLWTSQDNRTFQRCRRGFVIRQGVLDRPHCRWSPAGNIPEEGTFRNWRLELSGLSLDAPLVVLEVTGKQTALGNQAFVLAEAVDSAGLAFPVLPSTEGDLSRGFAFWKEWPGWNNRTERVFEHYTWRGQPMALALHKLDNLPTLLEPAFEGARQVWLARLRRMLDAGADGVGIRTLCHHNACAEWLRYAFAEPVRSAFRERYGREVRPEEADYEAIRRIRGEFYTAFLRDAKALVDRYGKKLSVHLESGIEVPPCLDSRMQLQLDWETWLQEGLVDQIDLKFWCSQSPFVHEKVLPLARKRGVPVTIIDRNSFLRSARGVELAERLIREAYEAGFSGYSFYETADYVQLNPEGVPHPVGHAEAALSKAGDALATLQREV